jgi:hypothetical protein
MVDRFRAYARSRRGADVLRALFVLAVFALAALLDASRSGLHVTLAEGETHGIIGAIVGAILGFFKGFGTGSVDALRSVVETIRRGLVELGKQVIQGLWEAAKGLGRALAALGRALVDVIKPALQWAWKKLQALESWLKNFFAPVLKFLKTIKDHIDAFYKTYVRPIIDTIEFIRQLNRVLTALHIDVLQKVDSVLQQIETAIEKPFAWVRAQITQLQNWVDKIITLDGVFQRATLIASMSRYAPAWMRVAVAARSKPLSGDEAYAIERANETPDLPAVVADLRTYFEGGDVNIGAVIDEATERAREYYDAA